MKYTVHIRPAVQKVISKIEKKIAQKIIERIDLLGAITIWLLVGWYILQKFHSSF